MTFESDLRALKKFSRTARTPEDFTKIVTSFNYESDLAVALICSTLIEEAAELLLQAYMVNLKADERDNLFRGTGPLATLSAKVKVAYSLGLIGKRTRDNLNLAREIRNAFAHSKTPVTFDTKEVVNVCNRIDVAAHTEAPPELVNFGRPRDRYVVISMILWGALTARAKFGMPRSPELP